MNSVAVAPLADFVQPRYPEAQLVLFPITDRWCPSTACAACTGEWCSFCGLLDTHAKRIWCWERGHGTIERHGDP